MVFTLVRAARGGFSDEGDEAEGDEYIDESYEEAPAEPA